MPVSNAFLYSRAPHHPVFEHIIRLQIQHVQQRYYGPTAVAVTGPFCYGLALDYYGGNNTILNLDRGLRHHAAHSDDLLSSGNLTMTDGSVVPYEGAYTRNKTHDRPQSLPRMALEDPGMNATQEILFVWHAGLTK